MQNSQPLDRIVELELENKAKSSKTQKLANLEVKTEQQEKSIGDLQTKIESLEQYSRINNVIISGLSVQSYATAASPQEID